MEAVFYFSTMQLEGSIGVFDSGVGGTSIWKEIVAQLPYESTLYLADSANAPYGSKTPAHIKELCIKNTEKLIAHGAKIVVVACNTATTNAIDYLRASYPIPFIGIEPAIKPAALQSQNKSIGILATRGTLNSKLFSETSEKYTQDTKLIEVIGEGLVPLIEKGDLNNPALITLLQQYIAPMLEAQIDYLVLGCSHYPYLVPTLKKMLPEHVKIMDSGEAVARQTKNILTSKQLLQTRNCKAHHTLITNGDLAVFNLFINRFRESITGKHLNITVQKETF